jgi:formylglycine-generating enzyme required for sulfatase activity/TolB-like protein
LILPLIGIPKTDGENAALFISNVRELNAAYNVYNPRLVSQEINIANRPVPSVDLIDRDLIALGKRYEADYVLAGHITNLGDRRVLIMTMVNVETAQLVTGGYREIRNIGDIHVLLPSIIRKMIQITEFDALNAANLALLPFGIPPAGVSIHDADVLAQLLIIELANTGKYKIVRRLTSGNQRTDLGWYSNPDQTTVRALGAELNAPYTLSGKIVHMGEGRHYVAAQIIASETSALTTGGEVQYRNIADGLGLMAELAYLLTGVPGGMPSVFIPHNMVWVPSGTFIMGSQSYDTDEKPVHTAHIKSFFISKTEVTQDEYLEVMGTNPSGFQNRYGPVERVTWYDAIEYCNKLSQKEGLIPAYYGTNDQIYCDFNANGYRLPTEAEWEYAARGGNRDSLTFDRSGGNRADVLGWYKGNSGGTAHDVGVKNANSLGLYDMAGNVWEWCWDWYAPYEERTQDNPRGPMRGDRRVLRGGSWNSDDGWLRSTYRNVGKPDQRYRDVGFRVVRPSF